MPNYIAINCTRGCTCPAYQEAVALAKELGPDYEVSYQNEDPDLVALLSLMD